MKQTEWLLKGAVWSESSLFAQTSLSENLGTLWPRLPLKPGFDDMFSSCGKKNIWKCALCGFVFQRYGKSTYASNLSDHPMKMCCKMVWKFCEILKSYGELAFRWAKFCEILSHSVRYGMYVIVTWTCTWLI